MYAKGSTWITTTPRRKIAAVVAAAAVLVGAVGIGAPDADARRGMNFRTVQLDDTTTESNFSIRSSVDTSNQTTSFSHRGRRSTWS